MAFFLQSCNQSCDNLAQDVNKTLFNKKCTLKLASGLVPPGQAQDEEDEIGVDLAWSTIATSPSISGRKLHSSVLIGNSMCVWGGHNQNFLNTGACLNLLTGVWTPITTTNAPSARVFHANTSTGSLMCVWGGFNGSQTKSDGACYNPQLDSWTTITTTGAPSAAMDLDGVWTGTEMCIFGGSAKHCYNPSNNSWRQMSNTNIPAARSSHATVWTGNEMCVWGGNATSGSKSNTGGCYNPTSDTWTTITTTGAPSGRERVEGAYVDGYFCVFGGRIADGPITMTNTGGCFNIQSQSWHAIQETQLIAREHVTAISNGKEFCVWGGQDASSKFGDGSCYNPSTQNWRINVSDGSTPSARVSHTAIWHEKKMCIWGGDSGSYSSNGACLEFE
jgi:hypothetical protein